jgi:small subunit ribosomal protein S6
MSTEYKRVRDYELMVIFHPELSEEDLASESSRVEGHITSVDGSIRLINREAPWGRRRLAYPIRHGSRDVRDGVYVLYYFTSESSRLSDIEREIKLQDRVLRFLLTQQSAPIMEPAPAEEEGAEGDEGATAEGDTTTGQVEQTVSEPAADAVEPTPEVTGQETEAVSEDTTTTDEVSEGPEEAATSEETPA